MVVMGRAWFVLSSLVLLSTCSVCLGQTQPTTGWHLLARQNNLAGRLVPWATGTATANAGDPEARDFSVLGRRGEFRSPSDGKFELALFWPQLRNSELPAYVQWKQSSDPFAAATQWPVPDFQLSDKSAEDRFDPGFGGLAADTTWAAMADGFSGGLWYFAFGYTRPT